MDKTKIHLNLNDLNEWYARLQVDIPLNSKTPMAGFDQPSQNNEYLISLWMVADGSIEITVHPAKTYEEFENLTYAEIEEKQNVGS